MIFLLLGIPAFAQEEPAEKVVVEGFVVASLVKKYNNGYLVSIAPSKDFRWFPPFYTMGFKKYIERYRLQKSRRLTGASPDLLEFPMEMDKDDYFTIEEYISFSLRSTTLIFFGQGQGGNRLVMGEKYYLGIDPGGAWETLGDVFVWVKGTPALDAINPVWAKNYIPGDETYGWTERRSIGPANEKDTALLAKIHQLIWKELNEEAEEKDIKGSILNVLKRYNLEVLEVRFKIKSTPHYLVTINESAANYAYRFCLCYLFNPQGELAAKIVPLTLYDRNDTDKGFGCSLTVEHIYYSKTLDKDFVIIRGLPSRGGEVLLLLEKDGEILTISLDSWHGC